MDELQKSLDEKLKDGSLTIETYKKLSKELDLSLGEYTLFQEAKSSAQASGKLSLENANLIYRYLGNTPDQFNRQPLHVKLVLTQVFANMIKPVSHMSN